MKKVALIVTKIHSIVDGVSFIISGFVLFVLGILFTTGFLVINGSEAVESKEALMATAIILGVTYLVMALIFIPLGIIGINIGVKNANFLNVAKSKSEIIGRAIVTIIFASVPGGILMLCIPEDSFSSSKKEPNETSEGEVVDK